MNSAAISPTKIHRSGGVDMAPRLKVLKVEAPAARRAGVRVATPAELVDKLKNEAGVL